jgi:hypothetical protein
VRFELSTLPKHAESRVFVLRILNITEPVVCVIPNYDGWVPFPKEGGLVVGSQEPLAFWVDKRDNMMSRCLRELAEASK